MKDLAELRPHCGQRQDDGRWVYDPVLAMLSDKPLPPDKIVDLVSTKPLAEVWAQVRESLDELIKRAHLDDTGAIEKLALVAEGLVNELRTLTETHRKIVQGFAECRACWPVLLSRNPQDIEAAKALVGELRVGDKAPTPTRPGQRVDRGNFWTRLAYDALKTCRIVRGLVPSLRAHAKGAEARRVLQRFWGTDVNATIYYRKDGNTIVIPDWCKDCAKLTDPVTALNFQAWWKAAKFPVLQRWVRDQQLYQMALKQINYADARENEARQRAHALKQIQRAFRSLVGVRQERGPAT